MGAGDRRPDFGDSDNKGEEGYVQENTQRKKQPEMDLIDEAPFIFFKSR